MFKLIKEFLLGKEPPKVEISDNAWAAYMKENRIIRRAQTASCRRIGGLRI